jgi:hypothetical protein
MAEEASGSEHGAPPGRPSPGESATSPPVPVAPRTGSRRAAGPGSDFIPRGAIVLITIVLAVSGVLTLYSLWSFWPLTLATGKPPPEYQTVDYFGWHVHVTREELFFIVVALGGALGGFIHTLRSLTWYIGNRQLRWSWLPFNLMLPVIGALGGTVFYVVLRAGLFSSSSNVDAASPFGFTAVALLAGLFSEQAMEKLRLLASELFAQQPQGEDHVEPEKTS